MTLASAWQMISDAFTASPYLGAAVALVLWLSLCWKFRLVAIGRRRSLPKLILATFCLHSGHESGATLNALSEASAVPKSSGDCDRGRNAGSMAHTWTVGEIYQIYWTIIARGQVIQYTSLFIAFTAFSLLTMHFAGPRESVSLLNVANIVGVWFFVPLAMLGLLSLVLVLCSGHQLPCDGIKDHKPLTIILFAW
jgi:hypothetical protein